MDEDEKERGRHAGFDPVSGEVHGSGSGAGGGGNPDEDYDKDPTGGAGASHPLPGSDEARHNEIPEHLERDKGRGDDAEAAIQPPGDPVAPDGESYRLHVAPGGAPIPDQAAQGGRAGAVGVEDDLARDQAEHQDRGQSVAEEETDRG